MSEESIIAPLDVYNQRLISQVHPPDWTNPTPAECYDLVVIGAGTAGLVIAAGAAGLGLGLKIALIEKNLMGGDCLNVGCVPSKSMIRSGRVVADIRSAGAFGIYPAEPIEIDFGAVMTRMRRIRSELSPIDSADRFRKLGVDVFFGLAKFIDRQRIQIDGSNFSLKFKKAAIATGTEATSPDIEGLAAAGYLTNATVFSLTDRPKRLAVIGGGPIGCELAQVFQRLGCEVTLFHKNSHLLDREDEEAAQIIQNTLLKEGVNLVLEANLVRVEKTEAKVIYYDRNGVIESLAVDEILVATGRSPNVEGLNLEAAGVEYDLTKGIMVSDYLQTTNSHIYAAGDICMNWKFTHAADASARIVIKNALFSPFGLGRSKLSNLVMPWVTFTDPEVAHVGMYADEAKGIETDEIKIPFTSVDRAILDGEIEGFVKILHQKGSDRILGATIVGRHAGEMISEIILAIATRKGLNTLSTIIHSYPTQADAIGKAANAYRKTLLTDRTRFFLKLLAKFS
jgi:pyruvate/2-oxoglutarate dehydrogenase complex dihydrolipoamide dehydrogenase (E3) component